MGLFRPSRRKFWFWWENRRRWKTLDLLRADPVLGHGVAIAVRSDGVFLEMPDGRRFFWEPQVKGSLLGIPYTGTFEPVETELLSDLLRPSDTVFDIGANFGWYTTLFSRLVSPGGRVHSFEPVPPTFRELERNVRLNGSPAGVRLNSTALGERGGSVKLHVPTRLWLGPAFASAVRMHEGPHVSFDCPMESLDDYCSRVEPGTVHLIKCDVEGGELDVLRGAKTLLSSPNPPMWFLEVCEAYTAPFGYRPGDLFSFLREYGYECFHQADGKLRPTPRSGKLTEYNFLFVIPRLHGDRVARHLA